MSIPNSYTISMEKPKALISNAYNSILKESIQNSVNNNIDSFNLISICYERSLFEMRNNDIAKAKMHLIKAENMQKEFSSNALIYNLLNLWGLPIKAYFFYKLSEFSRAEKLLMQSINNASGLVKEGVYIVEFHKIQQLHNIARLYYKQKKAGYAGKIINEAVNFMISGESPSIGNEWSFLDLEKSPVSIKSTMILQLILESIGELLPPAVQDPVFYKALFEKLPIIQSDLLDGTFLDEWIFIRNLYLVDVDHNAFIELAIDYITSKPSKCDILKLSLMVCVGDLLKKSNNYDESFYKYLLKYSQKLRVSNRYKEAFRIHLNSKI